MPGAMARLEQRPPSRWLPLVYSLYLTYTQDSRSRCHVFDVSDHDDQRLRAMHGPGCRGLVDPVKRCTPKCGRHWREMCGSPNMCLSESPRGMALPLATSITSTCAVQRSTGTKCPHSYSERSERSLGSNETKPWSPLALSYHAGAKVEQEYRRRRT